MSDALPSNKPTAREVVWALCNAHARRGFIDLIESFPEEVDYFVSKYDEIFAHERKVKKLGLSDHERLIYHQKYSGPIFAEMTDWATNELESGRIETNGNLGGAIQYFLKHHHGLRKFLEVKGAGLDNNICEQAIKVIVLGRKNHLFFKTEAGAAIGDVITSLAMTANRAGVNVFDYFNDLQSHSEQVRKNPDAWVPWAYLAKKAGAAKAA